MIDDREIIEAKKQAEHFGLDFMQLKGINISQELISVIPEDVARKNKIIIYKKDQKNGQDHYYIAVADPARLQNKAPEILTKLKQEQNATFTLAITTPSDLEYALLNYKQKNTVEVKPKPVEPKHNFPEKKNTNSNSNNIVQSINLKSLGDISYEILTKFPENVARKYNIVVFDEIEDGKKIKVAMADSDNLQTQEIIDFIEDRNNIKIEQYETTEADINWALELYIKNKPKPEAMAPALHPPVETPLTSPVPAPVSVSAPTTIKQTPFSPVQKETVLPRPRPMPVSPRPQIKTVMQKPIQPQSKFVLQPPQLSREGKISIEIKPEELEGSEIRELYSGNQVPPPASANGKPLTVKPVATSEEEQNLDSMLPAGIRDVEDLVQIIKGGFVPKIVAAIIYLAVGLEASDIHLEADSVNLRLRYRIDGILKDILKMPSSLQAPIISRIKILSKLKIDEQRIPQDGRFNVLVSNRDIDLRVSTLPTVNGEKVVLRILDKSTGMIVLDKLGLVDNNLIRVQAAIDKPYGIVLVTGPTGSGKTTTLYAILKRINSPKVNIITLEDPVEYELSGINQCQIKPKIGFDFANGLRSILRQDPNIIMVGEIRDTETANMATHAALTGHLVLSTLHTNDAAGALPRLIDMGVEPYLITSSINAIVAQRLVRKLCVKCKTKITLPQRLINQIKEELNISNNPKIKSLAQTKMEFYGAEGCNYCKDGYKGRIGLYEVLSMDSRIEQLAVNRATASVIKRAALNSGMTTIRQDGFMKVLQGITSVDEVIRVTSK